MANINSLSNSYSSNTTSIYGNSNIISGLASGMDTEEMIKNSVSGYQNKITTLQQSATKLEWKQDAIRDITNQIAVITNKYTSYTSKTNLSSNGFFTGSTITTAEGGNADAVMATGKATSSITINSVEKLATAARYNVSAASLGFHNPINTTGSAITTSGQKNISTITGTLMVAAGNNRYTLEFGDKDVYSSAQELVDGINEKLKAQKAAVKATLSDGKINFASTATNGDSVYLNSATGDFKTQLGVQYASSSAATDRFSYTSIDVAGKTFDRQVDMAEYLSDKSVEVTLDGVTRKISVGTLDSSSSTPIAEQIQANLQTNLNRAFGNNQVTVSLDNGALKFDVRENSALMVKSDTEELGIGTGISSYFDTSRTLNSLLGDDFFKAKGNGTPVNDGTGVYHDIDGKRVDVEGTLLDDDGDPIYEEKDLVINGVSVGKFGKDAALDEVMNAIKSSTDAGVNVSFSRLTGEFVFTSNTTGEGQNIEFGDGLAKKLFGDTTSGTYGTFTAGSDAVVKATVNGRDLTLQRTTNTIDMDGMSVTLKKAFTSGDAITFKTTSDSDKIVDAIKGFVEDINKLMKDVHDAYTTSPAEKNSKHERYSPLTDDDKKDMSESAIKAYEDKAKQGILFGDTDLRTLYDKLRSVITPSGMAMGDLRDIGITQKYSENVTTLELNEDKLRAALESNPDKVRTVFATTQGNGGQLNGMMEKVKNTLNAYGSTSSGNPGILVRKAGSKLSSSSLTNNNIQKQINNINNQIESWQTKLSNRIDYYTKQYTQLEKLIATMNNQSSALMELSGGY